ncbi:MAG: DUF3386 domain-containing protein [Nitrospira sp.]|nr:DUF3386 domain-containing protein [Nitrospira sp.]MCP9463429.1 DUF3386 domain-containing protein [Nitrospira sp.]
MSALHNDMLPPEGSKERILVDDPDARALVQDAHEHMYKWPVDFPGYEAALTVNEEGKVWKGSVRLVPRRETIVELPGAGDVLTEWVRERLWTQGMHLAWIPFDQGDGKYVLSFAPEDEPGRPHPRGRKVLLTGGRLESWYRIKDHRYMQIGRLAPMTERRINTIEQYGSAPDGRLYASHYVMTYFTLDGHAVIGMESYVNDYAEIQGVWLPLRRSISIGHQGAVVTRVIDLLDHRLLS